jgi:thiamine-phosphate pyrophosphorylase
VATIRRLVGPNLFVGGTARDPGTGRRLVEEGASYLGVGPTFATRSKSGLPEPIGVAGVRAVASAVSVPVIAIAGITAQSVDEVIEAGAWGVAVIGAISDAPDPHSATHEMVLAVSKAVDALALADTNLPHLERP